MPEIDFSYTPGAANSFARQFDASRQNRMAAEEQQIQLDQLKSDRQAMLQLQDQLKAAGKDTDLNKVFDALIATGKPDYVMHGLEGKQRLTAQMDFERTGRDLYPELFGGGAAAAVPQPAPPAPQLPAAPALGSGMFGTGVSMNALAPTAAAAAPTTNALATTAPTNAMAKTPDQLRREIMFFSQSSDPRAKAMVSALTSQLTEITKPYVVGGNLVTGAGQTLFTAPPTAPSTPSKVAEYRFAQTPEGGGYRGTYQQFNEEQARAGRAPGATVNVNTGKKYGEAFATQIAEADMGKMATAEKAPQLAESANRIIDLVQQGNVFTGPAADIKLNIARALNVVGADNQEKIANTEALIAATGQSTLDAIKSAGLGTGQGFTDKDLKFLQGIAGGTIGLTPQTLTRLAELQHKTATRAAEAWGTRVKQIPSEALQGTGISTEPIKVPALKGRAANVVVTPDGQSHSFPTAEAAAKFKKAVGQ